MPSAEQVKQKELMPHASTRLQHVVHDEQDLVDKYVHFESDRTVRKEMITYKNDIMEQLELFRESQKKQIQTHFKQLELNRGGYGHPAYDNLHSTYLGHGNPHDPLGID